MVHKMHWLFLYLAILAEVTGTTCMKLSAGFTKFTPSVGIFVFYAIGMSAFTIAIKKIEISVAYAIWSGLGTVIIAAIGLFWFKEVINLSKIIAIGFVIFGVIILNLSGGRV
jgi:small multidrug resistance pump